VRSAATFVQFYLTHGQAGGCVGYYYFVSAVVV